MINKVTRAFYFLFIYNYYKLKFKELGYRTYISSPLKIDGASNISIGNRVHIGYKAWLAANPLTGVKASLSIGEGTQVGNFCHIYATGELSIGKKVLIADKVYISDNLHGYQNISVAILEQPIRQLPGVVIGDGAWLGEHVCIIGASVGKGSVIGANSVVLKDIPDYCVAVGSPARIVKRYDRVSQEWLKTDQEGNFL